MGKNGANTNCLAGVRCPGCGQQERFYITGSSRLEVTDDGSEVVGDHQWDNGSAIKCPECDLTGTVGRFTRGSGDSGRRRPA